MILPDVNVLLYAFRADSPDHDFYRDWLREVVNSPQAYGISPQVLASVIGLSTHPKIYREPSALSEALAFSRVLMEQPNAQIILPGERHWDIFGNICNSAQASGNLVQGAWLAALAIEWGCEWITLDEDFARFPEVRWRRLTP